MLSNWFSKNAAPDWMEYRQKLMNMLQEESELEEIVKLVGMDALSAPDRLKLETARSIREDFLHQNAFHEVDTYTSLNKQYLMMKLIMSYYDKAAEGLEKGASVEKLVALPVREQIGRFKYFTEKEVDGEFEKIDKEISAQVDEAVKTTED